MKLTGKICSQPIIQNLGPQQLDTLISSLKMDLCFLAMHDVSHSPAIDTGSCSEQHTTRHCEISTARGELENFAVSFLHILSYLDKALI